MKSALKPGDFVEVFVEKNSSKITHKGTILPRANLFEKGVLVLKLENGYNIGIKESTIVGEKVLKTYEPPKKVLKKVQDNPKLPTIAFLSTGGTISSRIDYKTGGVIADYGAEEFKELMPELEDIANIHAKKIGSYMSEDIQFKNMTQIAQDIKPYLEDKNIKGIVLTTGTDMMHYIASGLSFMLKKLNKPIIITGSQRSIDRGSSDAFENIICAVIAAKEWRAGELAVCMHETSDDGACMLSRGTKVRKMHTSRRDAFRPINEQPLARIKPTGEFEVLNNNFKKPNETVELAEKLEEKVGLVYIHPNIDPKIFDFYIKEKYKGLVIAGTAFGHVPNTLYDALQKAKDAGIVVCIVSQTLYGRTNAYVYTNLRNLSMKIGLTFLNDMLLETAYMKLAWVIANSKNNDDAIQLMKENLANEYVGEIDEVSFLR